MTHKILTSATALFLLLASPALAQTRQPAYASPWVKTAGAQVRLVAAPVTDPSPQTWQSAGIEVQLEPGAKTYWRSPGDTGVPPSVDFKGSTGISRQTLQFPAPAGFDDGAGGMAIGYRESMIFPVWFTIDTPPPPAASGGFFARKSEPVAPVKPTLAVTFNFGVCIKNMCMPAQAALSLEQGQGVFEAGLGDKLLAARNRVPAARKVGDPGTIGITAVSARRLGDKVEYEVATRVGEEARGAALFIEAKNGYVAQVQGAPIGGSQLFRAKAQASAGAKLGEGRLTLITPTYAIEVTLDLDAVANRP